MALEGSLQVFKLPEILQTVALQQYTGILTVQGESDIVAISFLRGQVVAADALNQTVEERLGRVLAARGQVRPEDFAAVTAEHQTGGGRPIDLLVSGGYVTRPQLLGALRSQTAELLAEVLRWQLGDFKFYSGEEVSYEDGFEPILVHELIAATPAEPQPAPAPAGAEPRRRDTPVPRLVRAPVTSSEESAETPRPRASAAAGETGPRLRLTEIAPTAAETPAAAGRAARAWPGSLLALIALSSLAFALLFRADRLALPFPGQQEALAAHEKARMTARYQKLDGAARTYFLLEGRYPEGLQALVEMGLLKQPDLADDDGRPLAYATGGLQYRVQPVEEWGESVSALGVAEAVTGNFLLDAEFLRNTGRSESAPLVLLD